MITLINFTKRIHKFLTH